MIEISNEEDVGGYGTYRMNHDGSITVTTQGNLPVIEDILIDIDTKEQYYVCRAENCGVEQLVTIPKQEAITGDGLYNYVNQGIDVDLVSKKSLAGVLREQERNLIEAGYEPQMVYSEPGIKRFRVNGEKRYFFAGDTCPVKEAYNVGDLRLGVKGTCDEWVEFVNDQFTDNPRAMFIICYSLSAMLRVMLGRSYSDEDNPILHIVGNSTTSKTTMLKLAVSVYGNPRIQQEKCGLASTFNATENALMQWVLTGQGLLFGIDEISILKSKDVTSLVYALASGRGKGRLNRDSTMKKTKTCKNLYLTTGEARLTGKTNENTGIYMRVMEFMNVSWTSGRKQAEDVKRFVDDHYGSVAIEYGEKLGSYYDKVGHDHIAELYDGCREEYIRQMGEEPRIERLSSRYGLVLLTAMLAHELIGLNSDPETIMDFLLSYSKKMPIQKTVHDNYEELCQILSAYHLRFGRFEYKDGKKKYIGAVSDDWGHIETDIRKKTDKMGRKIALRYYVKPVFFNRIVTNDLGLEDPVLFASQLRDEGYITVADSERNKRNQVQKRVENTNLRYIAVNFFEPEAQDDDDATDYDDEFVEIDKSMIPLEFLVDRKAVDPIYNKVGL